MRSLKSAHVVLLLLCAGGAADAIAQSLHVKVEPVLRVGAPADVLVVVADELGQRATGYLGKVQFTTENSSSDVAALPAAYAFTPEDAGAHLFAGALVPKVEGGFTLRVTDVLTGLTGAVEVHAVSELSPIIVREANPYAVAGVPWAYSASGNVSAKGALPMEFSVCSGPDGFWVDATTGRVSWTPTAAGTDALICVRAKNGYGSDEYWFGVEVKAAAPAVPPRVWLYGQPTEVFAGRDVFFATESAVDVSAAPARYQWWFGDGTAQSGTESMTRHRYLVPGGFNAEVRLTDAFGAKATARLPIRVLHPDGRVPPSASIGFAKGDAGAVSFWCDCSTNTLDLGLTYRWDFGNGLYSSEPAPTVTLAPGRYHPTLLVAAANGLVALDTTEVVIEGTTGAPPSCDAWAQPSAGMAPLSTVLSSAPAAGGAAIVKVEWRIDGAAYAGADVQHEFLAGVHDARLLVKAADGQTCTSTVPIFALAPSGEMPPAIVTAPPPPVACGAEWIYQPVAAGTGPFTWELKEAPRGMSVDASTGTVRWIADPRGVSPFRLKVSNATASSAQSIALPVPCQPVELKTTGCAAAGGMPALLAGALAWLGLRLRRRRG